MLLQFYYLQSLLWQISARKVYHFKGPIFYSFQNLYFSSRTPLEQPHMTNCSLKIYLALCLEPNAENLIFIFKTGTKTELPCIVTNLGEGYVQCQCSL